MKKRTVVTLALLACHFGCSDEGEEGQNATGGTGGASAGSSGKGGSAGTSSGGTSGAAGTGTSGGASGSSGSGGAGGSGGSTAVSLMDSPECAAFCARLTADCSYDCTPEDDCVVDPGECDASMLDFFACVAEAAPDDLLCGPNYYSVIGCTTDTELCN